MSGHHNQMHQENTKRRMLSPKIAALLILVLIALIISVRVYEVLSTPYYEEENNFFTDRALKSLPHDHPPIKSGVMYVGIHSAIVVSTPLETIIPELIILPDPSSIYRVINKEDLDLREGYLILVNPDVSYEIPDDLDLSLISNQQSSAIRIELANFQLRRSILAPLDKMMTDYVAHSNSRSVIIVSAFRTLATQRTMRARHGVLAAHPGYSEHHTGLALDFGIISGGSQSTFRGTGATSWITENSHIYGFILRYPANKTTITKTPYEPWHFRYIGLPHSTIVTERGWAFEEYINALREHTIDNPLIEEVDGVIYMIYFTTDDTILIPVLAEFEISGNNVDGFIVTIVQERMED